MLKKLSISLIMLAFATFPIKAQASEQFDVSYNVNYKVNLSGTTQVIQKISITNKQDDIFATKHNLTVKQMEIFDVGGNDDEGDLGIVVEKKGDSTTINTKFNQQVIGEGRTYNWELSYKSDDIATRVGRIWYISIPKIESLGETNSYQVTLEVPEALGPEIYVSPAPEQKTQGIYRKYYFEKDSLMGASISASFGNYQVFNFNLSYKLFNPNIFSIYQDIALPPDIPNKQQVSFFSLVPKPEKIYKDKDGNILARYKVDPKKEKNISLAGSARIGNFQINPDDGGLASKLSKDLVKLYTKDQKYWEVESETIQAIAQNLYNPNHTAAQNAQKAYDYVTAKLEYDFSIAEKEFIDRNGALKTLTTDSTWGCMEFTDTFIAISRAMGIPTRELNGYALAGENTNTPLSINLEGGDVLHSWAEFYDPNFGWVQVDPTWGNTSQTDYFTKLDTNHFVFAIKGVDSEFPFPAGAYKLEGSEKQVDVQIAQNEDLTIFRPDLTLYQILSLNPSKMGLLIVNNSRTAIYNVGNTGKEILPFTTKKIFVDKDEESLYYEDFNKNPLEKDLNIREGKPEGYYINKIKNLLPATLVFVVLGLCSLFYVSLIHPKILQKLRARLPHRPQDQDQ